MTDKNGQEPAELAIRPVHHIAPLQPLSGRNRARVTVLREGALDYRNIPSRHANQLVPFKHCATVTGEADQG